MTLARRAPVAAVLVTLGVVTAGCSGPSRQDMLATAARARTHVVSEIRGLYLTMYHAHFAWQLGGMSGEYQGCPTSSRSSELAYYVFFDALRSFSQRLDSGTYSQQAVSLARAAGWKYIRQEPSSNGYTDYFLDKNSITLRMSVRQVSKKAGDYSVVTAWGPCFDAGSEADSLRNGSQDYPLPQPSPVPSSTPPGP